MITNSINDKKDDKNNDDEVMKSKDDRQDDGELDDVMTLPHSNCCTIARPRSTLLCTSEEVNKRLCDS